jgi:hypothetical protein
MAAPGVTLRGGAVMPALAWGTGTSWFTRTPSDLDAATNSELQANIVDALRAGIRHLDCAEMCVRLGVRWLLGAGMRLTRCARVRC